MKLVKTNASGYSVDLDSGAVINTDDRELQSYRREIKQFQEIEYLRQTVEMLAREVMSLKRDT
jgi:hypothetical protein